MITYDYIYCILYDYVIIYIYIHMYDYLIIHIYIYNYIHTRRPGGSPSANMLILAVFCGTKWT